jgi:hypothetical protein
VTDRAPEAFDPIAIIRTLLDHRVRFVVIGGIAAGVQGAMWATTDLDICHARDRDDFQHLADALAKLEATPEGMPADVSVTLDARGLRRGDWWSLRTRFGKLDCLGEPAPGIDYVYLAPRARRISGEVSYLVASAEDLLEMKRAAGRLKDGAHIEILAATIEERDALRADEPR